MLTATTIIWVFMFLWLILIEEYSDVREALGHLIVIFILGGIIGWAIVYDLVDSNTVLANQLTMQSPGLLIISMSSLGVFSIIRLYWFVSRRGDYKFTSDILPNFVVVGFQIVGFISSILGIISFYLEYLRIE